MARVSLVFQTLLGNANNPIENADLVIARASSSKSPSDFGVKRFGQNSFDPIKRVVISKRCEIVTVDDTSDIPRSMIRDARG